jgi:hypothetical protein
LSTPTLLTRACRWRFRTVLIPLSWSGPIT